MNRRIMLLLLLLAAIGCDGAEEVAGPKTIPDKTVVLTFDDGVLSHLTTVMPLLKELGFGATFYATFAYMKDWENYLDWKEIAEFHKAGFEVGNHTWTSAGFQDPDLAPQLLNELRGVESRLAEVGVPSPVTLAWPGCAFGPEALAELEKTGVQFARRGMQPELPQGTQVGPLYDPKKHHPLLIPTSGDLRHDTTLTTFKRMVDRAVPGKAVILQFHGVPDGANPAVSTPPDRFRKFMQYLKDGGFHVIALRDLAKWVDPKVRPDDPIARVRCPDYR